MNYSIGEMSQTIEEGSEGHDPSMSFDANTFISYLLKVKALKERIENAEHAIAFMVPGKSSRWMKDLAVFTKILDQIYFEQDPNDKDIYKSTAGVCLEVNQNSIRLISAELMTFTDNEESNVMDMLSSFTIDTEGIKAQVYVLDVAYPPPWSTSLLDDKHADESGGEEERPGEEALIKPTSSLDSFMITSSDMPWRDALLKKLRIPEAAPIVKEIKRIIKYLAQDTTCTIDKAETMQQFYEDLRGMLQKNPAWKDATKEEVDGSLDAIEKYIFSKCGTFVYQATDLDDTVQDRLFAEKLTSLSKFSFSSLVGPSDPNDNDRENSDEALLITDETRKEATLILEACSDRDSPIEKLDALISFVKLCAIKSGVEGSADLLLPAMMLVVLKGIPLTLVSDVRYIQRFRNHGRLIGESSYCLTNIIAVITMIEKLYSEQVSKTDPIYSMLASKDDLRIVEKSTLGDKTAVTSPLVEFNSVASSFINTIGFVPRAIGSAVADTFRSRNTRVQGPDLAKSSMTTSSSMPPSKSQSAEPVTSSIILSDDIKNLRKKFTEKGMTEFKELKSKITLKEIDLIIEDYVNLLQRL